MACGTSTRSTQSSRSAGSSPAPAASSQPVQSAVPARATTPAAPVARTYSVYSDADALAFANSTQALYNDPQFKKARGLYISDTNPYGDGFSYSQHLNYKLDNGIPLNATEKSMDKNIQKGMRKIGKDSELVRYCHDDIIQALGVSDYSKMSDSALKSALVGTQFQTTSYMSTSYTGTKSKSPFAPGQPAGGGREVILKIKAGSDTKMILGARKQAEIVLDKGTNFKVTDISFDGSYAYPRTKSKRMPRVVLEIETV